MKLQMAFFLFLITLTAIIFNHQLAPVFTVSLAAGGAFITDSILIRLRGIKPFPLEASLVSGLIIGLLLAPGLPWYVILTAAIFAMLSKNFIRYENRHIFNPAAFGLLISSIIFHTNISWWAVSWQTLELKFFSILFFAVLLSPGIVSFVKLQRYKIILSFWVTYIILLFILKVSPSFDPTVIFFSLVMLPEPMTTPNYPIRQLIFGPSVAIISILSGSLVFALLTANLIFYILNIFVNRFNIKI